MSLPTRERGLKYNPKVYIRRGELSLPTRERGLKSETGNSSNASGKSLPTRERGLKYVWRWFDDADKGRSLHGSVD